jgi:hypothetical protein
MFENLHDWSGAFFAEMLQGKTEADRQRRSVLALREDFVAGVAFVHEHIRGSIAWRSAGARVRRPCRCHTQHDNRGKSARILEAGKRLEIMQTGCDVHHGFRQGRDGRGAGLSPAMRLRCSGVRGGERGRGFEWQAPALKTWQPKHRDGGGGQAPKPRSGAALPAGLCARRQSR